MTFLCDYVGGNSVVFRYGVVANIAVSFSRSISRGYEVLVAVVSSGKRQSRAALGIRFLFRFVYVITRDSRGLFRFLDYDQGIRLRVVRPFFVGMKGVSGYLGNFFPHAGLLSP